MTQAQIKSAAAVARKHGWKAIPVVLVVAGALFFLKPGAAKDAVTTEQVEAALTAVTQLQQHAPDEYRVAVEREVPLNRAISEAWAARRK